jgi:hypothetical protein
MNPICWYHHKRDPLTMHTPVFLKGKKVDNPTKCGIQAAATDDRTFSQLWIKAEHPKGDNEKSRFSVCVTQCNS